MLYEADRHEPLTSTPWDESAVRNCIEDVVRDAAARYSAWELWPSHPLEYSPEVRWNLYVGAAGVIWALNHLASSGVSTDLPDISKSVQGLLEPNRSWIRGGNNSALGTDGLLTGDAGILLLAARLGQLASVEDQIAMAVDANRDNAVREFMWGSPGTALASLWLYEWTGKEIWADKFRRDVGILWERLERVEAAGCHLWSQTSTATRRFTSARCTALQATRFRSSVVGGSLPRASNHAGPNAWRNHSGEPLFVRTIVRIGPSPSSSIDQAGRPCWCSIVTVLRAS